MCFIECPKMLLALLTKSLKSPSSSESDIMHGLEFDAHGSDEDTHGHRVRDGEERDGQRQRRCCCWRPQTLGRCWSCCCCCCCYCRTVCCCRSLARSRNSNQLSSVLRRSTLIATTTTTTTTASSRKCLTATFFLNAWQFFFGRVWLESRNVAHEEVLLSVSNEGVLELSCLSDRVAAAAAVFLPELTQWKLNRSSRSIGWWRNSPTTILALSRALPLLSIIVHVSVNYSGQMKSSNLWDDVENSYLLINDYA